MYRQSEKILLLNGNISSVCRHSMLNFCPLTAEICWRVWGTPANFNGFFVLAWLLHRRRSSDVIQTLHDVWLSPALVYCICILGLLPPNRIFPDAKFTLRPNHVFSYIGSVTARHSKTGRESNCGIQQRAPPIFGRWPSCWALAHILVVGFIIRLPPPLQ